MIWKVYVTVVAYAMMAALLTACEDRPLDDVALPTWSAGELHNELLQRAESFEGSPAERVHQAALELRRKTPSRSLRQDLPISAAIAWGERIAPRILELLESSPRRRQIARFLLGEGVSPRDVQILAPTIEATLVREALPTFSKPARSEAEAIFRDVALHSSEHWSSRGKLNKDQQIVLADAVGAILGMGWGPFGGIAGAAVVSVIAAA